MKENEMIFGIRAVIEAIQADKEIDKILVRRDLQGELAKELFDVLHGTTIQVQRVPQERLDRYTRKNHQGVIAFYISHYLIKSWKTLFLLYMSRAVILSLSCSTV